MRPLPKVAIIIINYNGREDTLECLESLSALTYPAYAVYVVDQPFGAKETERDGVSAAIQAQFPAVVVIENPVNNGFAGGNNTGMQKALADGADYIFLLNNDTTVAPDLLEPLVMLAESDPKIGIVGPTMLYYSDPETVWATGGTIGAMGASHLVDEGKPFSTHLMQPAERDFIVGCGLLAKRDLLEKVGLFDERYFLYYEESDLCARAKKAGWCVWHQPASRLWHKVSRSTGTESELTLYYMRRNVLLYLRRHGAWHTVLWAILDDGYLAAVWTMRKNYRRRTVLIRAVTDFLRGRFGKTNFTFQK